MKQNPSTRVRQSYGRQRDSRTLSSDFDKFLHSQITSRHLKVPQGEAISGSKTWPFTDRRGYRSLESGFLLESPSTYRRPSPSACPAKRLETRDPLWSLFNGTCNTVRVSPSRSYQTRNGKRCATRWEVSLQQRVLIAFRMSSIVVLFRYKRVLRASK